MIDSLALQVEQAVSHGDPANRRTMLRRITSLFAGTSAHLVEGQVDAFDTVLLTLARNVETMARADLSEDLADIPNAPRGVIRDLAFDERISVAGPVLSRSPRIDEDDLVRIAEDRGQDHLYAVSRRRTLSERVTDVLVVRGDTRVVHAVAGNEQARLSKAGYDLLAERARADAVLDAMLGARVDAAGKRREPAAEAAPVDRGRLEQAVARVADRSGADLDEGQVVAWLGEGRIMEACVAVARIADVPPEMALRAFETAHYDPLLFLLRSVRFGWGTLKLFLMARAEARMLPEEMHGIFEAFQALSVTTAQRVVRFTASRDHAPARARSG